MSSPRPELAGIFIYPVKSLRGVRLTEAVIENGRLPGDRLWVLVDPTGAFMHQRDHPRMARIAATPTPNGIRLRSEGLADLEIASPHAGGSSAGEIVHVPLWRRAVPAVHVGRAADAWFARAMGRPCHLLAFAAGAEAGAVPESEVHSALHDATPFHLTSEDSLADLNRRLESPIPPLPMDRFRPNLVVRGAEPYAEDGWQAIAIGGSVFRWIKPCTRCAMTTTDQATGARASPEPLLTLSKYRLVAGHVLFGHYFAAQTWSGVLRVGDEVVPLR